MEVLFICRDALENSVVSNLAVAIEMKKSGTNVGVLFTEEALAAMAGGVMDWSPLLRDRETRTTVAKAAAGLGIPWAAQDPRWTRPGQVLAAAKAAGVSLLACPMWTEMLGAKGKLPAELGLLDLPTALKTIKEAQVVIGSF
ncbi:MAG: hypothetical protein QGH66_08750 [Dehalococcoidia bacterium]|nr:hypothetical protein [Dehalococcoidia bacterium]